MESGNVFIKIIEWVWVPVLASLVHIYMRLFGIESRSGLLEQQQVWQEQQRIENKTSRDEQRREILAKIDSHNDMVMKRIDRLETSIKNGR